LTSAAAGVHFDKAQPDSAHLIVQPYSLRRAESNSEAAVYGRHSDSAFVGGEP